MLEHGRRAPEECRRVLEGEYGAGPVCRLLGELGGADRIARTGRGLEPVVGQRHEVAFRLTLGPVLESRGEQLVQADAPRRGQRARQRVADDRVDEGVAAGLAGDLGDQPSTDRRVEHVEGVVDRQTDHLGDDGELELGAVDRGGVEHRVSLGP